jgi:hypothetical protein
MATRDVTPKAVKEVPAEEFIQAYAAHLKSTDKVGGMQPFACKNSALA